VAEREVRRRELTDRISASQRSANMRAICSNDMKPEMRVRRLAHKMGFRFRLHRKDLPGRPDMVFVSRRSVIFIHGCFWHQHPKPSCKDSRPPKTNTSYWQPKLAGNQARDARNEASLLALGWRVLTVWECQTQDEKALRHALLTFLDT
jgi:DNA mismatch endonuclease, patch repair protein